MPCILKIRVVGARDLPVMDKASDLTDAYVEVRFADFEAQRTTVCRKTLNPVWNEVKNKIKWRLAFIFAMRLFTLQQCNEYPTHKDIVWMHW